MNKINDIENLFEEAGSLIISHIEIKKMWGRQNFKIKFNPFMNILIGKNGCGKTSIVSAIIACLRMDFQILKSLDLSSVKMGFIKSESSAPFCEIKITRKKESAFSYALGEFTINIYDGEGIKVCEFEQNWRPRVKSFFGGPLSELAYDVSSSNNSREADILSEALCRSVAYSWLPVDRSVIGTKSDSYLSEDKPPLERRIMRDLESFKVFTAGIKSQQYALQLQYQKKIIEALMFERYDDAADDVLLNTDVNSLEVEALGVLNITGLDSDGNFTELTNKVRENIKILRIGHEPEAEKSRRFLKLIFTLSNLCRKTNNDIHMLQELMYLPLEVIKEFITPKHPSVTEENELVFVLPRKNNQQDGDRISTSNLSSGERQILAMMLDAFARRNERVVYIADEPEISLHIEWQAMLLNKLSQLAPKAQFIVATHSPDLVSNFSDYVIGLD